MSDLGLVSTPRGPPVAASSEGGPWPALAGRSDLKAPPLSLGGGDFIVTLT